MSERRTRRSRLLTLTAGAVLVVLVAPIAIRSPGMVRHCTFTSATADLASGLDLFMVDVGRYPTEREGREALVANPGLESWQGPYLRSKAVPLDPWGHAYIYRARADEESGRPYELIVDNHRLVRE